MVTPGQLSVAVRVMGPVNRLDDVTPANFDAVISLAGLSPGTHTLQPRVTVPPDFELVSVGSVTITLVPVSGGGP